MNIIYGVLPYQYLPQLGGIKFLAGFSYDSKAILGVKFLEELQNGILFSALVENNDDYKYPLFSGQINNILITEPQIRNIRKLTHQQELLLNEHARKKRERKAKNLVLTTRNWKQFIGKRKAIVDLYTSISNSGEHYV